MGIFTELLHPRGKGAQGGQFVSKNAQGQTTRTDHISYNAGKGRGTGYAHKNGDPNVKALQKELNRLGIFDSAGNQLKVDGKFGPKTNSAVRRLQSRLGMKPDGKVTPALLNHLRKLKPDAHDVHAMHVRHLGVVAKKAAAHKAHTAHTAHAAHTAHQKTVAKKAPAKKVPLPPARKATSARKG